MVAVGQQLGYPDDGPRGWQEPVDAHPLVVVELAQVVAAAVRQEHDERCGSPGPRRGQLSANLERGHQRRPARFPGKDAFFAGQSTSHRERFAIADPDPAIDGRGIECPGQEVFANALGQVGMGQVPRQDAALGICPDHDQLGVLATQESDRPRDRSAGTHAAHEVGDPPVRLLPDLGACRVLVGARILRVPVLVRLVCAGDVARQSRGHAVIALGRLGRHVRRAQHHLRAVGPQECLLLGRLLVGHDEDAAIALQRGGNRQAVASVAARRLDDGAARLEEAIAFRRLDHGQPDAVLHRAPGIEHLELRQEQRLLIGRAEVASDPAQANQGRPANQLENGLGELHPGEDSARARTRRPPRQCSPSGTMCPTTTT